MTQATPREGTRLLPIRGRSQNSGKAKRQAPEPLGAERSGQNLLAGALQENVLAALCFDTEACPVIIAAVDTSLFESSIYRTIADKAIAYFRQYEKAPGEAHLPDLLEAELARGKKARLYFDALHDLRALAKTMDRHFVLDQLQEFVSRQILRRSITIAAEELQQGNQQAAVAELTKGLERAGSSSQALLDGVHSWRDFRRLEFEPVEDALFPILQKPGITQIAGFRGEGKTWVALSMAVALASGQEVFGWTCAKPYRVLFVDGELPPWTLQDRIAAAIADRGVRPKRDCLHVLSAYGSDTAQPINLADPQQTDALVARFTQFDIVFLDNLSALISGVDLNDAQAWESINAVSMRCRGKGTSIVRIQHLGKDKSKGGRGSSRQEDPLDVSLVLERQSPLTFHGNEIIRITCNKMRNHSMSDFKPIDLEFSTGQRGIQISHERAYRSKTEAMLPEITELMTQDKWKDVNQTKFAEKYNVDKSRVSRAAKTAKERLRQQAEEESLINQS